MGEFKEHYWGDDEFDWNGLNDAGTYIGCWLQTGVRMSVTTIKEKFGTLIIYCHFGWSSFYHVWRQYYMWVPKWWPYSLDLWISYNTPILNWLNRIVIPIQKKAYIWRYKKAVEKWPHLYDEIVCCADYGELFDGKLPGFKYSDYWKSI